MANYQKENEIMNSIIVNADDFGLNEHCSKAIAETFEQGLVTDTTMMATGEYFDEAVTLAKERGFIDKIGIHLNLTEGIPLTDDIKSCPRFVTEGRFNKKYDRTKRLTAEESAAIYKELSAQADKIQRAGITITHADSHHHIHTGIFVAPIAVKVCKEHGINKIRLHRNVGHINFIKRLVKERYNNWLRDQGFVTTKYFAYVMDIDGFNVPDNTEIMIHPDYDKDGKLVDRRGMEDGYPIGNPIPPYGAQPNIVLRGYKEL